MKRFKWMVIAALGLIAVSYVSEYTTESMIQQQWGVDADDDIVYEDALNTEAIEPEHYTEESGKFAWKEKSFENYVYMQSEQGWIEEFFDGEDESAYCYSGMVLIPGTTLLPSGLLGFAYFIFLCFLFLGISIVADIFMEAIEVITSKATTVEKYDPITEKYITVDELQWNPTIANLTLMALGSSAPEILLAVIEALGTLGKPAGPLGASTIVGSAAFNLLVISAVAIVAVDIEPKKIFDTKVFATTALFSIFAYLWLYICLVVNTPGEVTLQEAWLTLGFFGILVVLAFIADKITASQTSKLELASLSADKLKEHNMTVKRNELRQKAKQIGEEATILIAQGSESDATAQVYADTKKEILRLYSEILETSDVSRFSPKELRAPLLPVSLNEKFAARKANNFGGQKDFIDLKGAKGQVENIVLAEEQNDEISFSCLHMSVLESSGSVKLKIVKKVATDLRFGVRTIEDTAKNTEHFTHYDQQHTLSKSQDSIEIAIDIIDNSEFQPDNEFFVEIYDIGTGQKMFGDDTKAKVTILDEDFPGRLGLEVKDIEISQLEKCFDIKIQRENGSTGSISCVVRTAAMTGIQDDDTAYENVHYKPKSERVVFNTGESEKTVRFELVAGHNPSKAINDDQDIDEEISDKMFQIIMESPQPEGVQMSKKRNCVVTIVFDQEKQLEMENNNLNVRLFLEQQEVTWGQQFLNAVTCGPSITQDDIEVDEVTMSEGLFHFATIGWKVLFATIPPAHWGQGWPCFFVALAYIGIVTMIVGEVATILGCAIGLKASVTAITLVALGTSLPDTFASKAAAQNSQYADSAVGNVTGSNCVNVFLGLGLPWLISAQYMAKHGNGQEFQVPPGDLAFSVALYLGTSICCFIIFIIRRLLIGGELGGPSASKNASAIILVMLWFVYVIFSSLKAYKVIGNEE